MILQSGFRLVWSKRNFFFQAFFDKNFVVFVKNGILRSAKQFCEVDLDSWGQDATFFSQAFFYKNFDVLSKKAFCKVLNDFAKWI
jgi:hypothetical protein